MSGNPVGNPLMQLLCGDLNSDRNRAIFRFLLHKTAIALRYVFPARATVCYGAMVIGFALTFIPIAKNAPARLTLMLTLAGAGMVAVSAHVDVEPEVSLLVTQISAMCDVSSRVVRRLTILFLVVLLTH